MLAFPAIAQEPAAARREPIDLSPAGWPDGELERYRAIDFDWEAPSKLATGKRAMIATTSQGGTAVRAGLEALRQGGNAVDAALVTALTQITTVMGSWTSFAGELVMVVYDAESGETYAVSAPFGSVKGETDPLSIPRPAVGEGSGRSVMVPGFMAGLELAHDRFGSLPFAALFGPAIWFAEHGFELNAGYLSMIDGRREFLDRLPQTRRVFRRPDGEPLAAGDLFPQRELAATLRRVAEGGAAYMYRGPWAEKLVAAARADGGRITMADLRAYRAVLRRPWLADYRGYRIAALAHETAEAFHLLELARLPADPPWWERPESLYWLIQISRVGPLLSVAPSRAGFEPTDLFGDLEVSPRARVLPATARAIWGRMNRPDWNAALREAFREVTPPGPHSDAVVAADERGNVVALAHSIGTYLWGTNGIFVDGVSISDAGSGMKGYMAETVPGLPMNEFMNPAIALREGRPVAASAAVGRGLHEATIQNLLALLDLGLDPKAAIESPKFLTPFYDPQAELNREYYKQLVPEGDFSDEVLAGLAGLGQEAVVQPAASYVGRGFWVGLAIDPESGGIEGGAWLGDAWAEGY